MMTAKGYAKLIEECGELLQVLGKRLAYYHTEQHPDKGPPLYVRMEDEIGDVMAACRFVIEANNLDRLTIDARSDVKLNLFRSWHQEQDNNRDAIDRPTVETSARLPHEPVEHIRGAKDCEKCGGAGWLYGRELDDADEETVRDTMTKYSCDGVKCRDLRLGVSETERHD